jgi:hypothetical protein
MVEFTSCSEAELVSAFGLLFPQGFAGPDVVEELAPAGWETSPLLAVCHPTPEQVYEETARVHRNLAVLRKPDDHSPAPPEPTLEEVARHWRQTPIEMVREVRDLVGQCLWDVFSDNHEVVAPDGRVLDLGSFRASADFLADQLNRQIEAERYDYMDFYMGTIWIAQRADLGPVYRMIFRRLRRLELDWVYQFPRLHAVDLAPLKDVLARNEEPEWLTYSPSEALAKEEEQERREQQLADLRESLAAAYREGIEEALKRPPPTTVAAYQVVYGRYPRGWPPSP